MEKLVYAWMPWLIAAFGYFVQEGLFSLPSVLESSLRHSLNFSSTQIGMFSSAFLITFVLLQTPFGMLFDKYSSRKLIAISYFLMMMGCFIFSITTDFFAAFLSRLLMGAGAAFTFVGAIYMTRSWFSKKLFSTMVGLTEMMSALAMLLVAALFILLAHFFNWRMTMAFFGLILAIMCLLSLFYVKDNPHVHKHDFKMRKEITTALRNKKVWLLSIYGSLAYSHFMVVISMWATPFFKYRYHLNTFNATILDSSCILGYLLGCALNIFKLKKLFCMPFCCKLFYMCLLFSCIFQQSLLLFLNSLRAH
jgi:MFS family permease